ncbi:MAG: hypothetical protein QOD92_250, partial [Acidimicrobiaceae bacterium]
MLRSRRRTRHLGALALLVLALAVLP